MKRIHRVSAIAFAIALFNVQAFALGGGRLAATQAISGIASEVSGPMAYGISLIAIVASAVSWYRHHHEFGALGQSIAGVGLVGGIAMGATSLMGFIPGVAGALI